MQSHGTRVKREVTYVKSVFYDKLDQVLGTRDIVTMKHVVEAGQAPHLRLFRAQTLQVIMMGHSQARVERQVLQKVALLLVASVGPAVKYRMAKSIWPAPANSTGRKGSEQQRGNCQPKTPERKRHFPSRKALESIEKQGEKLTAVMEGMQQNHGKQLEMMASLWASLLEAIKDKKIDAWQLTFSFNGLFRPTIPIVTVYRV